MLPALAFYQMLRMYMKYRRLTFGPDDFYSGVGGLAN